MKKLTSTLLVIGGLNWGLIGFFQFNLVGAIFGGDATLVSRLIYALVGLSAVYQMFSFSNRGRIYISNEQDALKKAA